MKYNKLILAVIICIGSNSFSQKKWEIAGQAFIDIPGDSGGVIQNYFTAIDCSDKNNCTAAGTIYTRPSDASKKLPYYSDLIWRTSDGGKTWSPQHSPRDSYMGKIKRLHNVCMIDSQYAFIVGDSGVVLNTTNGGSDWKLQRLTWYKLSAVDFLNRNNGIICGGGGFIAMTSDGGTSWRTDSLYKTYFVDCKVLSPTTFYIVDQYYGKMFITKNGGISWDTVTIYEDYLGNMGSSTGKQTYASYPLDSNRIFICGGHTAQAGDKNGDSYITLTTNSGLTWSDIYDQSSPLYSHLLDIDFANTVNGVAVGSNTLNILLTSDGGKTWLPDALNLDISPSYMKVSMPSPDRIFIAVPSGLATGYLIQWRGEYLQASTNSESFTKTYSLYPIPARDYLVINSSLSEPFEYTIVDALGREILKGSSSDAMVRINTQQFLSGWYSAMIKNKEIVVTRQFIVNR